MKYEKNNPGDWTISNGLISTTRSGTNMDNYRVWGRVCKNCDGDWIAYPANPGYPHEVFKTRYEAAEYCYETFIAFAHDDGAYHFDDYSALYRFIERDCKDLNDLIFAGMGLKGGWIAVRMVKDGMAIFKGFNYDQGYGVESLVWELGKVEFRSSGLHEVVVDD